MSKLAWSSTLHAQRDLLRIRVPDHDSKDDKFADPGARPVQLNGHLQALLDRHPIRGFRPQRNSKGSAEENGGDPLMCVHGLTPIRQSRTRPS